MKLLLKNYYNTFKNRLKFCLKYYTDYTVLFISILVLFLGFMVYRSFDNNNGIEIGEYLNFKNLINIFKIQFFSGLTFISYIFSGFIIKCYTKTNSNMKYLPINKINILLTEILIAIILMIIFFLLPIAISFYFMGVNLNFFINLFNFTFLFIIAYIYFPIITYIFINNKLNKKLLFYPYILIIEILTSILNINILMSNHLIYYIILLLVELIVIILSLRSIKKNNYNFQFNNYIKKEVEEKPLTLKKYNYVNMTLVELKRNKRIFIEFIIIPAILIICSRIFNFFLIERYIYYYIGFIPSFFMGMYLSYKDIYDIIPINKYIMMSVRFLIGIGIMIIILLLMKILKLDLNMTLIINAIIFSIILYIFSYILNIKLIINRNENPFFYIGLAIFQYIYSTIILYIREFLFMGLNIITDDYIVSLFLLLIMSLILFIKKIEFNFN